MKNRQLPTESATGRIPILSSALHCAAMTVLVYLRSGFGYLCFRPRSMFFLFAWVQVLFSIYAWMEPGAWPRYRAAVLFGIGAVILYCFHFARSVTSQVRRTASHDADSGTSHLLRLMPTKGHSANSQAETLIHLCIEPVLVLAPVLALRILFAERVLSTWLAIASAALFFEECINRWYALRVAKRQEDVVEDAEEKMEREVPQPTVDSRPTEGARTEKVRRKRSNEDAGEEFRYAQILRLMPPYTLEQAEENFRALMNEAHPDRHGNTPQSTQRAADLNAAIEFFRKRLRSSD